MDTKARPWMADVEIEIMDSLFKTQRPARVLEWGAGGSTLYWPPKYRFIKSWLAVEHSKGFAKALRGQVAAKVTVKGATGKRYWNQAGEYDMIIVDGHYRPECLTVARELLAEGGIVVLHDSGRSAYNVAWELYPFSETLYAGEKRKEDRYYKHRGSAVFWLDEAVETGGWCREYVVESDMPERPSYVPPVVEEVEVEAEEDEYLSDVALAKLAAGKLEVEMEEGVECREDDADAWQYDEGPFPREQFEAELAAATEPL